VYPNLKLAIFRKGLPQNRVSRILGIDEANLSRIIHGYRKPSNAQRRLVANYLEADEIWLFEKFDGGGQSRLVSDSEHRQEDEDRELPQGND
jgi:transcriptional regulator with XRE-family HTH domain